jgi:Asp-tRNA(Asn)/Glu-tRNA(Gln) amidotransferase A subunit family amidase
MSEAPPQDAGVDRRAFVARVAALSAGAAALPAVSAAAVPARRVPAGGYADEVREQAIADPTELTIAEAATLIRRRELSSEELVRAQLERIERFEPTYRAFNLVLGEQALARARRLDRRRPRGPLHGIPLAIKDNFFTAGVRTTANSDVFADFVPTYDATTVARLTAAGAIVLGKTQMGPLATTRAMTSDGEVTTVNAWTPEDPTVNPGGSSTGTATAVAGRMATAGTGTQTGGSITGPANAQGLTGLKPTMGRASLYGIIPLTSTRDHPGPLARDARDAAIMLQAMAGPDERDPRTLGLPPVPDLVAAARPARRRGTVRVRYPTRLGVLPGWAEGTTPGAQARRALLTTLGQIGVEVVDVPLPAEWELLTGTAFNNVRLPERSEPFLDALRTDVRAFGVTLNSWIGGLFLGGAEFLKGQRAKLLLLERVLETWFAEVDLVVQEGPVPFDIIGLPEIAFPIGFGASEAGARVPLGALVGGPPFAEQRLLALVAAYQAVTGWHLERPPDPAAEGAGARAAARGRRALRLTAEEVAATSQ